MPAFRRSASHSSEDIFQWSCLQSPAGVSSHCPDERSANRVQTACRGRLGMSCLVALCRPETGAVRSQHLVADYDISVFIETKLKFCVCNDNAFCLKHNQHIFYTERWCSREASLHTRLLFPGSIFPDGRCSAHKRYFRHDLRFQPFVDGV